MSATQVILLERIEHLGNMGEIVNVKPGYARNYLLPQSKALRATKDNLAYFEAQRKVLEAENDKRKAEAQKRADKLKGVTVAIIRQASEGGQLYGSVTARDIAEDLTTMTGEKIERNMVEINQNFKVIGLLPVVIRLHPEVKVEVTVNIARTKDEAATQEKTGRALVAEAGGIVEANKEEQLAEAEEEALEEVLDEEALEARRAAEEAEAAEAEAKTADDAQPAEAEEKAEA